MVQITKTSSFWNGKLRPKRDLQSMNNSGKFSITKEFWVTALVVFILDILTKAYITTNLKVSESFQLTSFLSITHTQNTGISFGFLQGFPLGMTFIIIAIIAIILYNYKELAIDKISTYAVGGIIGGAFGNLLDRLTIGTVTDFINFHFWPSFNVADTAISIGAIILVWKMWKE
ncbi:MAG: signal peptidase II [Candidatus Nanoarchaeia archaeon]